MVIAIHLKLAHDYTQSACHQNFANAYFLQTEATLKEQMESTHRLEVQFGIVKQRAEERRLRIQTVVRK